MFQLVKLEFGEKNFVRNVVRAPKSAARLVVSEDRLEAGSMSVEEQFMPFSVVELTASNDIPEQCQWMAVEHP